MQIKAYILFNVNSGSEKEVCKKISDFKEVLDTSVVYGEYDLVARVSVEDLGQLNTIVDEARVIPGVIFTRTMIVAQEYKGKTRRDGSNPT
jgi:DNA-binding Lrp family transcriptional regulator